MTDVLPIRARGERTPTRGDSRHWQFPSSRKVYVNGVGMREISLSPTRLPGGGVEENPPLRVYDTSGPYSDPAIELDRLKMSLRDNFVTAWVKENGFGGVDMARLAKSIDQIALTYDFKNRPKAEDIFTSQYLPPAAERKL